MKNLLVVFAASLLLAACATQKSSDVAANGGAAGSASGGAAGMNAKGGSANSAALAEDLKAMQAKSVYFDFDKSDVKSQYHDTIESEANWLKAHGAYKVALEGNADERGSDEYNLALGNRRATSVHRMLAALGVNNANMKDVSYGYERPRLTCHEEKCWKENRRVDFNYSQQ